MLDWIIRTMESLGYAGVALLMLLENVFPPIPSEVIMPLAGFIVARGEWSLWGAIAAGTLGSLAGQLPWYLIGRRAGEERLKKWADRHGRWLTVCGQDIEKAHDWFDRHGKRAVLIGRLIPGVRTFISLPAGFDRMGWLPFLGATLAGTVIWTTALVVAGRLLGARYEQVSKVLEPVSWVVLGGVLALYLWRVVRWKSGDEGARRARK
jgi:membrane protein DedA with SNARE-associated domain